MKEIVRTRFSETIPNSSVEGMDALEFKRACDVAFEVIGYAPKNPQNFTQKSLENFLENFLKNPSKNPTLFEAIYEIWRIDYGS